MPGCRRIGRGLEQEAVNRELIMLLLSGDFLSSYSSCRAAPLRTRMKNKDLKEWVYKIWNL